MRNKSGNRWNADHIPVSMSFQCHKQILRRKQVYKLECKMQKLQQQSWLTRPPSALPDGKRWTYNETLIHLSIARKACTPTTPHPDHPSSSLCGATRGFYQRHEDLMNIHVANTAGDATEFAEISAEKSPLCKNTQVHSCCTVCMRGDAALSLCLFLCLSLTSRPPTHIQMSKCTHMHGLESTYMLSCLHGLAGEHCGPNLHFSFMEFLRSTIRTICIS